MTDCYYLLPHPEDGDLDLSFDPNMSRISDADYFDYFYHKQSPLPDTAVFRFSVGTADPAFVDRADVMPCSAGFLMSVRLFEALEPLIGDEVVWKRAEVVIAPDRAIDYRIFRTTKDLAILDADANRFHTWINARLRSDLLDDFNVATDLATREIAFSHRVADLVKAGSYRCAVKKITSGQVS